MTFVTVSSFCGTDSWTSSAVGVFGVRASGCTVIAGCRRKRGSSQPVIRACGPVCHGVNTPGCCQESIRIWIAPLVSHCEGSVRNGLMSVVNGVPIAVSPKLGSVAFMRSGSCAGSPGTPHSVRLAPRTASTAIASRIVAITA